MLEYQAWEAGLCPSCRHERSATFGRENQKAWDAEAHRCHACAAVQRERERWQGYDDADTAGLFIVPIDTREG